MPLKNDQQVQDIADLKADVRYIRESMDDVKQAFKMHLIDVSEATTKYNQRLGSVEDFQAKQKVYITLAAGIGGAIVWLSEQLITIYTRLKGH